MKKNKNLIKFKKYVKSQKKTFKILVFVMLMASSLGMILPILYSKRIIGITDFSLNMVVKYSIFIIVIIIFHHIFWFFWEKVASILTNNIAYNIKCEVIDSMLNTKHSIIKNKTSGYYLERINDDIFEVASFLPNTLGTIVDSLTNLSFLILIYFFNYKCGLIFTTGIIILYLIDYIKLKIDLKYTDMLKKLNEKNSTKINEIFKGIKDIKGLGFKYRIKDDTLILNEEIKKIKIRKDSTYALFSRIKTFLQYFIETILIVYSVGVLIPNNELTTVLLLTIINYSGFMYDLVGFIAKTKEQYMKSEYKAGRVLEILNNKNFESYGKYNKPLKNYNIKIKNLFYKYDDDKEYVLKNLNIEIKQCTSNVFIGSSGSGKSTLFGILTKLNDVDKSKIFIGDIDINNLSEKKLRDTITIINQETFLLNDTIYNNIKLVKPNATTEEILEACKKANILEDINKFEKNLIQL